MAFSSGRAVPTMSVGREEEEEVGGGAGGGGVVKSEHRSTRRSSKWSGGLPRTATTRWRGRRSCVSVRTAFYWEEVT